MATIKEEILEKCKSILHSTPIGTPVTNEDYDFLMGVVFPLHPDWKSKLSGRSVKLIITRRNDYGSRYFSMLMDDDTFENMSVYECINRRGLKDDIISAAWNAVQGIELPPLEGRKKKRPDFPSVVRKWTETITGEEFSVGKYLMFDEQTGQVFFSNQDLINSFRSYYMQNG
jgi:hypothetical protein